MSTLFVTFIIYLITIASSVDSFLKFLAVLGGIAFVVNVIFTAFLWDESYNFNMDDGGEKYNTQMAQIRTWRRWALGIFILGAMNIFVPNERQAITILAVMIGYEGVTTIVENDRVQKIGSKTVDYLEDWLNNEIEELHTKEPQPEG